MSAPQTEFTIFTAEGITFTAAGHNLVGALRKIAALTKDHQIVAVVETASVVTPAPGKLTALIVRQSSAHRPV